MNSVVRFGVLGTLALAAFAALPVSTTRGMLATAASTLFESTPFILAGVALAAAARGDGLAALLGCGCGRGPSARSLPAAIATGVVFGPLVAIARFSAGWMVGRLLRGARRDCTHEAGALSDLHALLPAATGSAVALHVAGSFDPHALAPAAQMAAGAAIAFLAAPCALGAVALAGAIHVRSAAAATGFLAIAGIADVRALFVRKTRAARADAHDALAYGLASVALATVALRHGAALVHPAFAIPLGISAGACAVAMVRFRSRQHWPARIAPAIMLAGAVMGAPAPEYRATETTMSGLFAGERLAFTGALVRKGPHDAVVRYAVTCCRADATPVVVRLARRAAYTNGTWLRADGIVRALGDTLQLDAERVTAVPAPADPFVYR